MEAREGLRPLHRVPWIKDPATVLAQFGEGSLTMMQEIGFKLSV